jgi:HK97 family phage major capsid protein
MASLPVDVLQSVEQVKTLIHEFRATHEAELKSHDALHTAKMAKLADEVAKGVERYNETKASLDKLLTMANRTVTASPVEDEIVAHKKEWEKKAGLHFSSYIRGKEGASGQRIELAAFLGNKNVTQDFTSHALRVNVEADGGYLVIPVYSDTITARIYETSPMRQLATTFTISGDRFLQPIEATEISDGGWIGEEESRSVTNTLQFGEIEIPMCEIYAQPRVTQKMLDDAKIDVETYLMDKVSQKMARTQNTAFISGNSVKRPTGILTYSAWSSAGVFEANKIEQVNSGSAADLTADGLQRLQNSLLEAYEPNATWLMKRQTFGSVMLLKDGDGNYLFNRALDRNVGIPYSLLNRPLMFATDMDAVGANALAIAYGDFRSAYLIIEKPGISLLRDPFTTKGSVLFYHTMRVGGKVVNFEAIKIQKVAV